jgi:hypothetical protein
MSAPNTCIEFRGLGQPSPDGVACRETQSIADGAPMARISSDHSVFKDLDGAVRSSIRSRFGKKFSNTRLTAMGLLGVYVWCRTLRREAGGRSAP